MGAIFGQCPLCPANPKRPQRLYGGYCKYHLSRQSDAPAAIVTKEDLQKDIDAKLLKKFYAEQVLLIPAYCENCGGRISYPASMPKKSAVAHILEKKNFRSVMVHPENRWFGCWDCHSDYDKKGWSFAVTMEVWPLCVIRFRMFMAQIKPAEFKFLPQPLADILHSTG